MDVNQYQALFDCWSSKKYLGCRERANDTQVNGSRLDHRFMTDLEGFVFDLGTEFLVFTKDLIRPVDVFAAYSRYWYQLLKIFLTVWMKKRFISLTIFIHYINCIYQVFDLYGNLYFLLSINHVICNKTLIYRELCIISFIQKTIPPILRAQWPLATYLYTASLSAYLQKFNKVKIHKTTYW